MEYNGISYKNQLPWYPQGSQECLGIAWNIVEYHIKINSLGTHKGLSYFKRHLKARVSKSLGNFTSCFCARATLSLLCVRVDVKQSTNNRKLCLCPCNPFANLCMSTSRSLSNFTSCVCALATLSLLRAC